MLPSYFSTTITSCCSATTAMKLARSLFHPGAFFRRRRATPFFSRRRRGSAAADNNPEPSSPKVTCIGQVRVKSQKRVKKYRRRISGGEASFRSAEPSFQHQQRRSQRDQRWVHLPSISVLLRAVGHEFCCFFRCCRCTCSCFERRERETTVMMRRSGSACEDGRGELFGRWLVAVHGGGGSRSEIEAAVDEEEEILGDSRRHVFDDIEVVGDRIEVKGGSFVNGGVSICIPPKNALLLMRCRSDPLKMAAIANRISSDALRYDNGASEDEDEEEDDGRKIFVIQVFEQEKKETMVNASSAENEDKSPLICSEEKIEEEEEEEEVESNMSSFEALLEQENVENYQDSSISIKDETLLEEEEEEEKEDESTKPDAEKSSSNGDDNPIPTKTVEENDKQGNDAVALPENQETAAAAEAEVLPECLLLMMREPKLSMEVSKETWVCATDFIRLLPERPRRVAAKAAAPPEQVKKRAAVEKSKPRVPPLPGKKNDVQPARSSCSLPAAAAAKERKRVSGGACEPLALTRCKSEPMSTAAAKLMPEPGCWKENVGMKMEPHRQATLGVGGGAAEVGV